MKQHSSTLPPEPQPNRERIFSMRLTDAERQSIETLAKRLNMLSPPLRIEPVEVRMFG